jgi:hypothetical protein
MELGVVAALAALGAFHGLNPGMGWLFAVALGLQEGDQRAVLRALPPIALGHAAAVLVALAAFSALRGLAEPQSLGVVLGGVLIGFGAWKLIRRRHPRWVGMRVRPWELAWWSFIMAGAHGAGLMVLPVAASIPESHPVTGMAAAAVVTGGPSLTASAIHTVAMLAVMAAVALVVFRYTGVGILRKAWINLDLMWAVALVVAGVAALFT